MHRAESLPFKKIYTGDFPALSESMKSRAPRTRRESPHGKDFFRLRQGFETELAE
jgi:hypothetical protein